jgi:AcrR family transcriptional regulator
MARATGLRERKKQRNRDALVEAGLSLFSERGYDGTTVEEISDAVDLSARTFFRYFETKDQVLFADLPQRVEALAEALRAHEGGGIADVVRLVVDFFAEELPRSADQMRVQLRVVADNTSLRAALFQHQAQLVDVVASELRSRELCRSLEAHMIASAVLSSIREKSLPWLLEQEPDLAEQLADIPARVMGLGSTLGS